ncbi:MAG: carboxypeptidase regulatory-like domain-containing protein [Candidatus Thermoplasmatota archaeon]
MQGSSTHRIWVIAVTLALIATMIAALPAPNKGAGTQPVAYQSEVWYIQGQVKSYTTGSYISGMSVSIENTTYPVDPVTTLSDGKFNFTVDSGDKDYILTFTHDAYGTSERKVWNRNSTNTPSFNNSSQTADMGVIGFWRLPYVSGTVREISGVALGGVTVTMRNDATDETLKTTTTSTDGTFTAYLNATTGMGVEVLFDLEGYYENSTKLTLEQDNALGTIYMEPITPTPTVELFGEVKNSVTQGLIKGARVSVSRDGVKWISALTDDTGYYSMMVYSGRFKVQVSLHGYYEYETWGDVPSVEWHNMDFTLTPTPPEIYKLKGYVKDGVGIPNAVVSIYDVNGTYENASNTGGDGSYNISFYDAEFRISVSAEGYFTDSSTYIDKTYDFTGTNYVNISMTEITLDRTVSGRVIKANKLPIPGATVTLYDRNRQYSNDTVTDENNGYYTIGAYDGNFALLADAPGYQSKLVFVDIAGTSISRYITLDESGKDAMTRGILFANWTAFQLIESTVLAVDNASHRAEADINYGSGSLGLDVNDWNLNDSEIAAWEEFLENQGYGELYTDPFFTIDGFKYEQDTATFDVRIENASGDIASTLAHIFINTTVNYTLMDPDGEFDAEADEHLLAFNISHDGKYLDNSAWVALPEGFEMVSNVSSVQPLDMQGWNNVSINPQEGDGEVTVEITAGRSRNGTAVAQIVDGIYYVLNGTPENYTVIVRKADPTEPVNTTVVFSAEESSDPVGSLAHANFTWDFGYHIDGNTSLPRAMGYGIRVEHNYTNVSGVFEARLNITETGGNVTNVSLIVKVDDTAPTAEITVVSENLTLAGGALYVDEDIEITLNGTGSEDTIHGDEEGVLDTWYWSWGDGSANETVTMGGDNNITHAYEEPGNYTIKLNVTDVVGHRSADEEMKVVVNDTTAPEIRTLKIMNETWATAQSGRENLTYYFNASDVKDNYDGLENLTFHWDFGDNSTEAGIGKCNVSHVYRNVFTASINLTVTDRANNSDWAITPFSVGLGLRPNLFLDLDSLNLPQTVKAGSSVMISVNVTNKGEKNATGFAVRYSIKNPDGSETPISGKINVFDDNETQITTGILMPNQTVIVKMWWTPQQRGNYTIVVNATCTEEHKSQTWDNHNLNALQSSYIYVEEAEWVTYAIVGAVVAIIALVIAALYILRRRRLGMEPEEGRKKKKK